MDDSTSRFDHILSHTELSVSQDQILYPQSIGALTQLYAGTDPRAADWNGEVSTGDINYYELISLLVSL
jgi:hypothetical protein